MKAAAGATAVLQKLVVKYPDLTEAHYALGAGGTAVRQFRAGTAACAEGA